MAKEFFELGRQEWRRQLKPSLSNVAGREGQSEQSAGYVSANRAIGSAATAESDERSREQASVRAGARSLLSLSRQY